MDHDYDLRILYFQQYMYTYILVLQELNVRFKTFRKMLNILVTIPFHIGILFCHGSFWCQHTQSCTGIVAISVFPYSLSLYIYIINYSADESILYSTVQYT